MFLHSGASLHGHEYSTARSSAQLPPRRLPFLRSALRQTPEPDARTTETGLNSITDSKDSTSTSTLNPNSDPVPMASPPSPRPKSLREKAATSPRAPRPRPTSDYFPKRELSVRFREPGVEEEVAPSDVLQSEDEGSIACSDLSDLSDSSTTTKKRRKRKRAPRKSTQFVLAHPAPRLRAKQRRLVQTRPRLLLQLQELNDKRPIPAFDILPSSLVAGSIILPRLAMRCPRLFRVKPELGLNDLLVVRSEDYDSPASPHSPDVEDSLDQRDLLAVISPLPHMGIHAVEIVMDDGSTWESSLMPNGSYEFIGVDERGRIRTARWIKKPLSAAVRPLLLRSGTNDTPPSSPTPPESKWTFSMINPDSRRHPIMGSLASNTLDVFDTYNTMSTSSGRYPPTRPSGFDSPGGSIDWISTHPPVKEGRLTMTVPQDVKLLMVVTAAWLNLRLEGWPAVTASKPPQSQPSTHRRAQSNGMPPKAQTFPVRSNTSLVNGMQKIPQATTSPAPSIYESQRPETPGRRRSMSGSQGLVKRFIPRASMDGRPALEAIYINDLEKPGLEKPPSRRMSVRQLTSKIFRRGRSNSVAQ